MRSAVGPATERTTRHHQPPCPVLDRHRSDFDSRVRQTRYFSPARHCDSYDDLEQVRQYDESRSSSSTATDEGRVRSITYERGDPDEMCRCSCCLGGKPYASSSIGENPRFSPPHSYSDVQYPKKRSRDPESPDISSPLPAKRPCAAVNCRHREINLIPDPCLDCLGTGDAGTNLRPSRRGTRNASMKNKNNNWSGIFYLWSVLVCLAALTAVQARHTDESNEAIVSSRETQQQELADLRNATALVSSAKSEPGTQAMTSSSTVSHHHHRQQQQQQQSGKTASTSGHRTGHPPNKPPPVQQAPVVTRSDDLVSPSVQLTGGDSVGLVSASEGDGVGDGEESDSHHRSRVPVAPPWWWSAATACDAWRPPQHPYFQITFLMILLGCMAPARSVRGMLWLRTMLLAACAALLLWALRGTAFRHEEEFFARVAGSGGGGGHHYCRLDAAAWAAAVAAVNAAHIAIALCRALRPMRFTRELEEVYQALFKPLKVSRHQFKKVLDCMKLIRSLKYQEVYAQEKVTKVDSLSLVLSGKLVVSQNQRALHIVFPHQFLDSPEWFGVSTDEYFQVSITSMEESRVLIWHRDKLRLTIITDQFLQAVFDHILGRDVVKKLMQVSETMAVSNGYIPNSYEETAEDKPMLILKKNGDGHGITALINRQLQAATDPNAWRLGRIEETDHETPV